MRVNFLNLLAGTTDDFKIYPEFNTYAQKWQEDSLVKETRTILGTKDEHWALVVAKIAMSDHYLDLTTTLRSALPGVEYLDLLCPNAKLLVGDANGAPSTVPVDFPVEVWPATNIIDVQYTKGENWVSIYYNYKRWVVASHYHKDRLYVNWPKELGISGALLIPDSSTTIHMPINLRYPATLVATQLSQNASFYKLTEAVEHTHDFFYADNDYEKIGVAALSLAAYIDKNNTL